MKMCGITKHYGKRMVLDMPGFSFEQGKIYAVVGSNGSGKTTLARILAGTEKADNGIRPFEQGMNSCGYLPQHPYTFRMSTQANIRLSGDDEQRADELMKTLGIDTLKKEKAHHLSGGEQARMAMARIMMKDYDLLILDEPTASMDMEATMLAEQLIREYCHRTNACIIMITHSLAQAGRLADRVIFLKKGELIEEGAAEEVLDHPQKQETRKFVEFYR